MVCREKVFIDNSGVFDYYRNPLSGRNSAVECHLAKVDVDGSNPFARSIYFIQGGIAKWLRQRSAKPLFTGSNPVAASRDSERVAWYHATLFYMFRLGKKG